ncbi:MAG: NADH-quinone oxidoreductase subunit H [Candidatus Omnitrophica bacterium]|nr:NADH-quinone oxidoreductase subunit H [Candidatus Omnitrophota bacterium]MBU4149606.1 NADH-quinone oxidoreductase subunit H [Candidatus Omnitrophota bacterium]
MLKHLFNFIIFPGFLFTAVVGLAASWIDRKVTARVQWRVGPPWYQPLADLVKLSIKEITIPKNASKVVFLLAPLFGLSAVILAATFIWQANIQLGASGFTGDIVVILYLLTLPAIALILGSSASGNPLASLGVSREIKLMLAYELPFIICIIVPIIKSSGFLKMTDLIAFQAINGVFVSNISGILAILVAVFCMQAKLGLVPFDMAEAETEIMGGIYIEYSGILLAVLKLTKTIMMVALPVFLSSIFWGGFSVWKYVVLLVVMILMRNTNPRVRIDQALRFFWYRMTSLAIIAVLLATLGM